MYMYLCDPLGKCVKYPLFATFSPSQSPGSYIVQLSEIIAMVELFLRLSSLDTDCSLP